MLLNKVHIWNSVAIVPINSSFVCNGCSTCGSNEVLIDIIESAVKLSLLYHFNTAAVNYATLTLHTNTHVACCAQTLFITIYYDNK